MPRFKIALLVFFVSASAFAQVTLLPLTIRASTDETKDEVPFGPSQCATTIEVRWRVNVAQLLGSQLCSDMAMWATTSTSCGDAIRDGDVSFSAVPQTSLQIAPNTGVFLVELGKLPGFVTTALEDGGTAVGTECGALGVTKTHRICGSVDKSISQCGFTTATKMHASELKLVYDTEPPSAPVLSGEPLATNGQAVVGFVINTDALYVIPTVTRQAGDAGVAGEPERLEKAVASTGKVDVKGLTNDVTYDVQLSFVDAAGNESELSATTTVTPVETIGFWGVYKNAGGTDPGGCSVTAGLMPMLAAAVLLVLRRMSR